MNHAHNNQNAFNINFGGSQMFGDRLHVSGRRVFMISRQKLIEEAALQIGMTEAQKADLWPHWFGATHDPAADMTDEQIKALLGELDQADQEAEPEAGAE